jgi:hypothetical protein
MKDHPTAEVYNYVPDFGRNRCTVECICGHRNTAYLWSWAGKGALKCKGCGRWISRQGTIFGLPTGTRVRILKEVTDHKGNVHPPGTEAKYDNAFITTKEFMLRLKFYRKGLAEINEDDVEIIPEGAIEYNAR